MPSLTCTYLATKIRALTHTHTKTDVYIKTLDYTKCIFIAFVHVADICKLGTIVTPEPVLYHLPCVKRLDVGVHLHV